MNPFLKFVLIVLIVSLVIFAIGIGLIQWFVSIRRDHTENRSYGSGSYYTQLGNGFDAMGLPFDGDYAIEKYGPDWSDSKVYGSSDGDFRAKCLLFSRWLVG